jgi:hypothetical protein
VLSTPPAFVLSQDQTLRRESIRPVLYVRTCSVSKPLVIRKTRQTRRTAPPGVLPRDGSALAFDTLFSSQGANPAASTRPPNTGSLQRRYRRLSGQRLRRSRPGTNGYVRGSPCSVPLSGRWLPMQDPSPGLSQEPGYGTPAAQMPSTRPGVIPGPQLWRNDGCRPARLRRRSQEWFQQADRGAP